MRVPKNKNLAPKKFWLVSVSMGYGHERAAWPLRGFAEGGEIIIANNYPGIPEGDAKIWLNSEKFYNLISKLKDKAWLGELAFSIFDKFQGIPDFYPRRDRSAPSFQLKMLTRSIRNGWGRHLIEYLLQNPIPIVTTYFAVAHMAEMWNYPGQVYAIVTDSDIPRAWAPLEPSLSKIKYFAPTKRSAERLESYGVLKENIILTGFPLPQELIGEKDSIVKENLMRRLIRLDPNKKLKFLEAMGFEDLVSKDRKPPVLTLAIGGAGGQLNYAKNVINGLHSLISERKVKLNLVAGVSEKVVIYFEKVIRKANLTSRLGDNLQIIKSETKAEYFPSFESLIKETDILWTKPSELSFYASLGLPILLTPPVGAHEIENRKWLLDIGSGIDALPPEYSSEWLPDLIKAGNLAKAAFLGYSQMERSGQENILSEL